LAEAFFSVRSFDPLVYAAMLADTVLVSTFIVAVFVAGVVVELMQVPALIGQIGVGIAWMAFGAFPNGYTEPFKTLGSVGLLVMVFDGGVHMDPVVLRKVGMRAFIVGFAGVVSPVFFGSITLWLLGFPRLESFASGTALSSTAIGFTLQLMTKNGLLKTDLGQLIIAGAMIDDVLSMILLACLESLPLSDRELWPIARPLVSSVFLLCLCMALRTALARWLGLHSGSRKQGAGGQATGSGDDLPSDSLTVCAGCVAVLSMGIGMAALAEKMGSTYLLGAFMAGMIATACPSFENKWDEISAPVIPWLARAFFACTVGFSVPVTSMSAAPPLATTVLLLAAIVGKLVTGLLAAPLRSRNFAAYSMQVGWAMVGRGELGFVQIESALQSGLVDAQIYGATVWVLLISTLVGPIMFRWSLRLGKECGEPSANISAPSSGDNASPGSV